MNNSDDDVLCVCGHPKKDHRKVCGHPECGCISFFDVPEIDPDEVLLVPPDLHPWQEILLEKVLECISEGRSGKLSLRTHYDAECTINVEFTNYLN